MILIFNTVFVGLLCAWYGAKEESNLIFTVGFWIYTLGVFLYGGACAYPGPK